MANEYSKYAPSPITPVYTPHIQDPGSFSTIPQLSAISQLAMVAENRRDKNDEKLNEMMTKLYGIKALDKVEAFGKEFEVSDKAQADERVNYYNDRLKQLAEANSNSAPTVKRDLLLLAREVNEDLLRGDLSRFNNNYAQVQALYEAKRSYKPGEGGVDATIDPTIFNDIEEELYGFGQKGGTKQIKEDGSAQYSEITPKGVIGGFNLEKYSIQFAAGIPEVVDSESPEFKDIMGTFDKALMTQRTVTSKSVEKLATALNGVYDNSKLKGFVDRDAQLRWRRDGSITNEKGVPMVKVGDREVTLEQYKEGVKQNMIETFANTYAYEKVQQQPQIFDKGLGELEGLQLRKQALAAERQKAASEAAVRQKDYFGLTFGSSTKEAGTKISIPQEVRNALKEDGNFNYNTLGSIVKRSIAGREGQAGIYQKALQHPIMAAFKESLQKAFTEEGYAKMLAKATKSMSNKAGGTDSGEYIFLLNKMNEVQEANSAWVFDNFSGIDKDGNKTDIDVDDDFLPILQEQLNKYYDKGSYSVVLSKNGEARPAQAQKFILDKVGSNSEIRRRLKVLESSGITEIAKLVNSPGVTTVNNLYEKGYELGDITYTVDSGGNLIFDAKVIKKNKEGVGNEVGSVKIDPGKDMAKSVGKLIGTTLLENPDRNLDLVTAGYFLTGITDDVHNMKVNYMEKVLSLGKGQSVETNKTNEGANIKVEYEDAGRYKVTATYNGTSSTYICDQAEASLLYKIHNPNFRALYKNNPEKLQEYDSYVQALLSGKRRR